MYRRNEKYKLEDRDCDSPHRLLVDCFDDRGVVTHQGDSTAYPTVCPESDCEEDRIHLFPVDVLPTMLSVNMNRESVSAPDSPNTLGATRVCVNHNHRTCRATDNR